MQLNFSFEIESVKTIPIPAKISAEMQLPNVIEGILARTRIRVDQFVKANLGKIMEVTTAIGQKISPIGNLPYIGKDGCGQIAL